MRQLISLPILILALMVQSSLAQRGTPSPQADAGASAMQAAGQPPSPGNDALAQMRDDLNKLDSLNTNMSAEIEFLRDQNLQILLRTNVQMWRIMIQDLRRQVEQEEQRRATPVKPVAPAKGR
ncbi:MAG TPA: hypothetical protein VKB58_18645 [Terriglobales bacterium]|nr:hypothetical protein [Terriglobales bacterium]